MNFQPVDRLPIVEWATWWDKTVTRFHSEGLPAPDTSRFSHTTALARQFGHDVWQQVWMGWISGDAPAPAYHGAPRVETLEEYREFRKRYLSEKMAPNPALRDQLRYVREEHGGVVWFTVDGPFWGPRTLMGIEPHLTGFYDQPELMNAINEDLTRINLMHIDWLCEMIEPDFMTFAEDMSYNLGPMLSEKMFDQFMLPYYERIIPELKKRGIRVIVDSDGNITEALPWFQRAGIEGILPLERQAGVDLNALRAQYPRFLFIGGYDKMVMPKGIEPMRAEFERLLPVMRTGGYIASVDHQTPPGVSLENYHIYNALLREYCERAAREYAPLAP